MTHVRSPRSVLVAGLVALVLVLSGCGSSSDPESWEEAEADADDDGFPVKTNFIEACRLANEGEGGFSDNDARDYCRCSFDELREALDFDEFKTLDDALRTNPDPTDLDEEARDIWDIAEDLLDGCAAQVGA